jgi:hypothetical protein
MRLQATTNVRDQAKLGEATAIVGEFWRMSSPRSAEHLQLSKGPPRAKAPRASVAAFQTSNGLLRYRQKVPAIPEEPAPLDPSNARGCIVSQGVQMV